MTINPPDRRRRRTSAERRHRPGRRRVSRALTAVLAGATLLATATGCATGDSGVPASGSPAGASAAGYPRTVSHAMGESTVTRAPQRVVALDATFVDAALMLEVEVVGFTTYRSLGDKLPEYLGASATRYGSTSVPVGELTAPSLEKIAALKPDLILSAKVRHEELYDELRQIAPTVFSETTGGTWKDNVRLVGRATGREALAEQRIGEYEKRARAVGDAVRAKLGRNPTVSVVRFLDGPTRLYKEDTYSGVILSDAGFKRPASQTGTGFAAEISEEKILDIDADLIFVTTYQDDKGLSAQSREKFRANPLWGKLTGTVHEVSDLTWMTAVGPHGAGVVLDDLARILGVNG